MIEVPAKFPVTIPDEFTDATVGVPDVQVPPDVASVRVMVEPTHTDDDPEIADTIGRAFTVTVLVTVEVPQLLVTV